MKSYTFKYLYHIYMTYVPVDNPCRLGRCPSYSRFCLTYYPAQIYNMEYKQKLVENFKEFHLEKLGMSYTNWTTLD